MQDKTMKPQCKILNCITKMGLPEKLRKNNTSAFTCTQADYSVYYSGKELKINNWSNHQPSSDNKNNSHNHHNHPVGACTQADYNVYRSAKVGSKLVLRCLHSATIIAIKLSWCDIFIFALDQ